MARAEASLAELHELLLAAGIVVEEDAEPAEAVTDSAPPDDDGDEPPTAAPTIWPGIAFRTEPTEPEELIPVDCAERMRVCHEVCCKLNFALAPPEVEAARRSGISDSPT